MYLGVLLTIFTSISGGVSNSIAFSPSVKLYRYEPFAATMASRLTADNSIWRNRFSSNFQPLNPDFMKPAINSEPANFLEGPTNNIEPQTRAMPITIFPVFPWPSNMPSKNDIFTMFPQSGINEFWSRPQVDDRLSHFPMPGRPLPGSNYNHGLFDSAGALNPVSVTPTVWVRHTLSTYSTTTVPTTTTTATTLSTMTTISEAKSNHIWGLTEGSKQPTDQKTMSSLTFHSNSIENSVKQESELEKTTTTARTAKKFMPRYTKVNQPQLAARLRKKYDFLHNWKTKNFCRPLNPLTDSIPHPDSDQSCDPDLSRKQRSPSCRCRYLVATPNTLGCPSRYYTICWRVKTKQ